MTTGEINIFGHDAPYIVVICTTIFFLYFAILPLLKRKRKSWRVSASRRWLKHFRATRTNYTSAQRFAYIRKIDHFLFEDVLMTCFEERGCRIKRTPATRDGGSDGFVQIGKTMVVIQAKRYAGRISKQHVKDLENLVLASSSVTQGLFIHTGKSSLPILMYIKASDHIDILSGVDRILSFLDGDACTLCGESLNKLNP